MPETTIEKTGQAVDTKFDGTEEVVIIYWRCSHCGNTGADKPDEVPASCPYCDPGCYPGRYHHKDRGW